MTIFLSQFIFKNELSYISHRLWFIRDLSLGRLPLITQRRIHSVNNYGQPTNLKNKYLIIVV